MIDRIGGSPNVHPSHDVQRGLSNESYNKAGNDISFADSQKEDESPLEQIEEILPALINILEELAELIGDVTGDKESSESSESSKPSGKGTSNGAVINDDKTMGNESNQGKGNIPKPTEHLQEVDLGGKKMTIGGDGSASAQEVKATAESIKNLYQNSDSFKDMIDSSSDKGFEVSVGKRGDNTSWGNADGRVFMNINNIEPGDSNGFQSLLGHEFAHASIDLDHGAQLDNISSAVAAEA